MSTEGCVLNHTRDIDFNREYKKRASYHLTPCHQFCFILNIFHLIELGNSLGARSFKGVFQFQSSLSGARVQWLAASTRLVFVLPVGF